ncbi:hypothetical protein [Hymenobacter wooponensis]|uniref:hypothetical protein n=1 Tax=Hymenobacter wooponensis TaxID=1525360 RepID=UPI001AEC3DAC|nr:hypothetical protein [Hymenobacter wooponensis]
MSVIRPLDTEETREAAVLLVLLPQLAHDAALAVPAVSAADLAALQRQLGSGVQVLTVDQAANPAVVRSFAPLHLPACVLVYQGVELWRQEGLPSAEDVMPLVLAQKALASQQVVR